MSTAYRGAKHHAWRGGVAQYPNHYELKKQRLIKLQQTGGKCEVCGERAFCIHHIDGNKSNHVMENLVAVCQKCHHALHSNRQNPTSKFRRLYGMSLAEMSQRFGGSVTRYYYMHRCGELAQFIEKMLREDGKA